MPPSPNKCQLPMTMKHTMVGPPTNIPTSQDHPPWVAALLASRKDKCMELFLLGADIRGSAPGNKPACEPPEARRPAPPPHTPFRPSPPRLISLSHLPRPSPSRPSAVPHVPHIQHDTCRSASACNVLCRCSCICKTQEKAETAFAFPPPAARRFLLGHLPLDFR